MNGNKQKDALQLIEELSRVDFRLALLIGAAGAGKTTLIENLVATLSREFTVGIVDADIGQSHLGPPATVAWGKVTGGFPGWNAIYVESFYFTGAVSPTGNLLQLVTGAKLMADQALGVCDKVVVDTTGLVTGSAARALKQAKIDALMPDLVIALEKDDELSQMLGSCRWLKHPRVMSLPVSPLAREISPAERMTYRRKKFRSYFTGAHTLRLSLDHTGLRYTRDAPIQGLPGRLVSLRDDRNTDLALGIIEDLEREGRWLLIKTPLAEPGRVVIWAPPPEPLAKCESQR